MGLFGKLFGSKEQALPALDPSGAAAQRLGKFTAELETFVAKMNDRLEFVPGDEAAYCFIGKPPAMFGIAWFHDGKEHNLKTLAAAKGLGQKKLQKLSLSLGEAYEKFQAEPAYAHTIAGKHVIVKPSEGLRAAVADLLQGAHID